MIESDRLKEILEIKRESARRADLQMGDHPNSGAYMDSYATLMLAHATSLVALELNMLNSKMLRFKP